MKKLILLFLLVAVFISAAETAKSGNLTVPNSFSTGQVIEAADMNANFSAVETAIDDNDSRITTNAGNISSNSTNISSNSTAISSKQDRVTGTCASGSSIRVINTNGTVTCETDDTGGDTSSWTGTGNGTTTGDIYRTGRVGIGTSSVTNELQVGGTVEITPDRDGACGFRIRSADSSQNTCIKQKNSGESIIYGESWITLSSTFGVDVQDGSIWRPVNASSFNIQSSQNIKYNITHLGQEGAAEWFTTVIQNLQPSTYYYNWQDTSDKLNLGFIVEELPTELVSEDGKGVNLMALTTATVAAMQGLAVKVDEQQWEIENLQSRIAKLEALVQAGQ